MRNKKTIKEFRAFYIMASSVYAKSSRKRKWGVIVQCNKKHGRPSSEHPWEVIIPMGDVSKVKGGEIEPVDIITLRIYRKKPYFKGRSARKCALRY